MTDETAESSFFNTAEPAERPFFNADGTDESDRRPFCSSSVPGAGRALF